MLVGVKLNSEFLNKILHDPKNILLKIIS